MHEMRADGLLQHGGEREEWGVEEKKKSFKNNTARYIFSGLEMITIDWQSIKDLIEHVKFKRIDVIWY